MFAQYSALGWTVELLPRPVTSFIHTQSRRSALRGSGYAREPNSRNSANPASTSLRGKFPDSNEASLWRNNRS